MREKWSELSLLRGSVSLCLCLKTRLSAKMSSACSFILTQIKIIFIRMNRHFWSFEHSKALDGRGYCETSSFWWIQVHSMPSWSFFHKYCWIGPCLQISGVSFMEKNLAVSHNWFRLFLENKYLCFPLKEPYKKLILLL